MVQKNITVNRKVILKPSFSYKTKTIIAVKNSTIIYDFGIKKSQFEHFAFSIK